MENILLIFPHEGRVGGWVGAEARAKNKDWLKLINRTEYIFTMFQRINSNFQNFDDIWIKERAQLYMISPVICPNMLSTFSRASFESPKYQYPCTKSSENNWQPLMVEIDHQSIFAMAACQGINSSQSFPFKACQISFMMFWKWVSHNLSTQWNSAIFWQDATHKIDGQWRDKDQLTKF